MSDEREKVIERGADALEGLITCPMCRGTGYASACFDETTARCFTCAGLGKVKKDDVWAKSSLRPGSLYVNKADMKDIQEWLNEKK